MIKRAPVFFISHGGPNLLEDQAKPGHFYNWLGNFLKTILKPKAIVLISAHWQGANDNQVFVDISEKPKLIYDFYNFPDRYYRQTWDNKGSPALANTVIDLLNKAGFKGIGQEYGNDHGLWVPLKRAMASNPDIPIVEISTLSHENMEMHVKIGEALAPLRDEGVVIIGSGSAVHNLRMLWQGTDSSSPSFVSAFDSEMTRVATKLTAEERNLEACKLNQHSAFRLCHPTAEHLVPFHVALGASGEDEGKKLLEDYYSTLSWSSYGFGLPDDVDLPSYPNSEASI